MFMKWWTENSSANRNKLRHAGIAIICFILIITSACALLPKEAEEEVLPTITPPKLSQKPEYVVKTANLETKVRGIGKLMSQEEETLFFSDENKRMKEVYVKTGDEVQAGQLVAELDVTEIERQLRMDKLLFRKDELLMIESLRKADELSPDELEQAKIDFELKRTKLLELQESIDDAKMVAPFSGTIVSVSYQKGDLVTAYEPVVVLANLSKLTVAATISVDDLKKISVGMDVLVDINAAGQHHGKISRLPVPKQDSEQGGGGFGGNFGGNQQQQKDSIDQYTLVELDEFPPDVTRGTPLSITVVTQRKENVIVIPPAALRSHNGRNYVQLVDEQGNKREVDVEIGQQTSTEVEIVKGLEPGQKVVGK